MPCGRTAPGNTKPTGAVPIRGSTHWLRSASAGAAALVVGAPVASRAITMSTSHQRRRGGVMVEPFDAGGRDPCPRAQAALGERALAPRPRTRTIVNDTAVTLRTEALKQPQAVGLRKRGERKDEQADP